MRFVEDSDSKVQRNTERMEKVEVDVEEISMTSESQSKGPHSQSKRKIVQQSKYHTEQYLENL